MSVVGWGAGSQVLPPSGSCDICMYTCFFGLTSSMEEPVRHTCLLKLTIVHRDSMYQDLRTSVIQSMDGSEASFLVAAAATDCGDTTMSQCPFVDMHDCFAAALPP